MVHHYASMTKVAEVRDPECYKEAAKDTHWRPAMEEDMRALDANDTLDLIDPSRHCKTIGCKWVYRVKYNVLTVSVNWYKA